MRIEPPQPTPSIPIGLVRRIRDIIVATRELHDRERARVRAEIARVPGLMALLMKPCNGQPWSRVERDELHDQLRGLGRLGLYVVTLAVPGTTIMLPLVAWWLDRRQARRSDVIARTSPALRFPPGRP